MSKKKEIPPIPVTPENLEDVVRILKAGIHHQISASDDTKSMLKNWVANRENDIDRSEGRDPTERLRDTNPEPSPEIDEGIPNDQPLFPPLSSDENHPPYVGNLEERSSVAGSMEAAAAENERETNAHNPPPFLRGGNP